MDRLNLEQNCLAFNGVMFLEGSEALLSGQLAERQPLFSEMCTTR